MSSEICIDIETIPNRGLNDEMLKIVTEKTTSSRARIKDAVKFCGQQSLGVED